MSQLEVISIGSILYSHQVRLVKSRHFFAESDVIKLYILAICYRSNDIHAMHKLSSYTSIRDEQFYT